MLQVTQFIFQNDATATGEGNILDNGQGSKLTVAVSGTFVADVKMQGLLGGLWYDLPVVSLPSLDVAEKITSAGSYTVGGVEGFERIRANITSYSSGEVTVVGRLCF